MEWISVKDKLPNDGDHVIASYVDGPTHCLYIDGKFLESWNHTDLRVVTHWGKLMSPPEGEEWYL